MPKTGLCDKGILVLNTGILDPTYRGLISGIAINFRKTSYRIKQGDVFLRLVFEETSTPNRTRANAPAPLSQDAVRLYRSEKMLLAQGYGTTFLNVPEIARSVTETATTDLLNRERNTLLAIITIAAALFALLQFISPLIGKYFFSEDTVAAKVLQEMRSQQILDNAALKAYVDAQRVLIEDLRRRMDEQARARPIDAPSLKPREAHP
jgi:hypothetical protein